MSFISNAFKNLFNLLGQKTPTNNGVTSSDLVPLLNSSHAPKGDVSITDLASVLGGLDIETVYSGSIEDDKFRYNGRWYLTAAVEGVDTITILETLRVSSSRILQKKYVLNPIQVFVRTVSSISGIFSEWKEL